MAVPTPDIELAQRFRAARRLAEIGFDEAAAQLGVSRSTLHRIEKGQAPLRAAYLQIAIRDWKTPAWLLPGDVGDLTDLDEPARRLADLAQRERSQATGETPEEPGSDASIG